MASDKVIMLTNDNFQAEVIQSDKPVMVDFWAEWCGPCRALTPIVDELANQYSDQIKVCKLNVDEARQIAGQYQVMSIPTVLFFKNGEIVSQNVGARSKNFYVKIIETL